ncbi:uncharacterized protein LOC135844974 [Planococcus citri]|uniref:uncharacterized protein LOC135844974 n=1 Tax=Planococcus citri TaxID=170843 RepID=UPI0031F8F86B
MTETTSRVHDLAFPSPIPLKEISAIVLVAELWREEIARTEIKTEHELKLVKNIILLRKIIANIPSEIRDLLVEYVAKFETSIKTWLVLHSFILVSHLCLPCDKLSTFHDFVWDWNGNIDNVRTAKRIMLCDRFTAVVKFKIACLYCFEDDIRRIWPFVSSNFIDLKLNEIDFFHRTRQYGSIQFFYWIYCLRNELHNMPNPYNVQIEEMVLGFCEFDSYSCAEYFWNRIPYERRLQATCQDGHVTICDSDVFVRFFLQRLDDLQLAIFLTEIGVEFISKLLANEFKIYVLPAWMYIRNKMNKSHFTRIIEKLLNMETNSFTAKERLNSEDEVYICCELWRNSPENLKRSALNDLLSNEEVFKRIGTEKPEPLREMRFLITVLLDASFEQRHTFWCKNWRNLISGARVEDLMGVMKLCFRDENDMNLFKRQYNMSVT